VGPSSCPSCDLGCIEILWVRNPAGPVELLLSAPAHSQLRRTSAVGAPLLWRACVARDVESRRHKTASRQALAARLWLRPGNHVPRPLVAYTCRNRDARARTATHSRYTCGDTSQPLSTPTARLRILAGKRVHRPVMASTCCNRDAPAHTATHGKRNRVATTPLPVHSGRRGSGHGRETTCASQSWPPRVATETHRHTPRRTREQHRSPSMGTHRHAPPRTASESVSLQRRSPSTPAGGAPAAGEKTRTHANHGLHVLQLRRTNTHRDALEYSTAPHPWARTGTHHHAREAKACRYNAASRPLHPARLRTRAGKHVRTIIMDSTCFGWDAPPFRFCGASSCSGCAVRALPTTQAIAIGYSILEPSPRPYTATCTSAVGCCAVMSLSTRRFPYTRPCLGPIKTIFSART